jgi:hypothetical protein
MSARQGGGDSAEDGDMPPLQDGVVESDPSTR